MFRPAQMKKVTIILMDERRHSVLAKLKEMGVIHLIDVSTESDLFDFGLYQPDTTWIRKEASELLSKINQINDVFAQHLKREEKASFMDMLQPKPVKKVGVKELPPKVFFKTAREKLEAMEKRVTEIPPEIERLKEEERELLGYKNVLDIFAKIPMDPKNLKGYKTVFVTIGLTPSREVSTLTEEINSISEALHVTVEPYDSKSSTVLVSASREHEGEIMQVLRTHNFEETEAPLKFEELALKEAVGQIGAWMASNEKKMRELIQELESIAEIEGLTLLKIKEQLDIEKTLDEINIYFGRTSRTSVICGWVPVYSVEEVKKVVKKASKSDCLIYVEDPGEEDNPPTLLKNPPQTSAMELLTTTYGYPSYHELDPSSLIAFTFPITFGLMFGDVGHGLVLILLGYLIGVKMDTAGQLRKLGRILILCGIFSSLSGFLYGSVFGIETIIHPLLANPIMETSSLIPLALYFGVFQITVACLFNIVNEVRHKKYVEAFVSPWGVSGIWFLWGGTLMVRKYGTDLFGLFADKTMLLPLVGLPLMVVGLGAKFVEKKPSFMMIYEAYETISKFAFNTISHIRVIVVASVHAALCTVMVIMMESASSNAVGIALKVSIFLAGNLIIIALECLISFVQTLRLHYYELFSKFFEAKGRAFRPFKTDRKYTYLEKL